MSKIKVPMKATAAAGRPATITALLKKAVKAINSDDGDMDDNDLDTLEDLLKAMFDKAGKKLAKLGRWATDSDIDAYPDLDDYDLGSDSGDMGGHDYNCGYEMAFLVKDGRPPIMVNTHVDIDGNRGGMVHADVQVGGAKSKSFKVASTVDKDMLASLIAEVTKAASKPYKAPKAPKVVLPTFKIGDVAAFANQDGTAIIASELVQGPDGSMGYYIRGPFVKQKNLKKL